MDKATKYNKHMITKQEHNNITWIDVESPTQEEIHALMEEYEIHPAVAEELLLPSIKPKIELYENFIYLILHFPAFKHTHKGQQNQEVDFIIGKNFLITTRYDTIDPIHKFSKIFEVHSALHTEEHEDHIEILFFQMIKKLYGALEHELEYIRDSLREIETNVFKGKEKEMVIELSSVSRDLLNFKQAISLHKDIIEQFELSGQKFFGDSFPNQLKSVQRERNKVLHSLEIDIAFLTELRETNNSLLSSKQNEVMKVLTILAFITFPLSLVAAVFGMNTVYTPVLGINNDFWIIVSVMMAATFIMFLFFKYKKWL